MPTQARTRYRLGLDLGTTHTVAAIQRFDGVRHLPAELAELGTGRAAAPTALFITDEGEFLFGEAAVSAGRTDPMRLLRGFRRRIGDPTPVIVAGRSWKPEELTARMIRWAADLVAPDLGGHLPDRVIITHPVSWGAHPTGLLRAAVAAQGLRAVLVSEPRAAVFQMVSARRLAPGSAVGVYDLGGGTFDAAVVRITADASTPAYEILGPVGGDDRLGGADFDDAIFEHVRAALPELFASIDETDLAELAAVAQIRQACTVAKEQLTSNTEASIPVEIGGQQTTVRLHRSEFEVLIRPLVEQSVAILEWAIATAGLKPADLADVLLVGGSARIPLVAQLVSERLDRPVVLDDSPESVVARGAVLGSISRDGHVALIPRQVGPVAPTATTSTAEPSGATVAAAAPSRPERAATTLITPDLVSEPLLGLRVAGLLSMGAAMAVVAVVAIVACILIAYPTPAVGFDIPTRGVVTRHTPSEESAGTVPPGTVRHADPTNRTPQVGGPPAPAAVPAPTAGPAPSSLLSKRLVSATTRANPDPGPKPDPSLRPSLEPGSEPEKELATTPTELTTMPTIEPTIAQTTEPPPGPPPPVVDPPPAPTQP